MRKRPSQQLFDQDQAEYREPEAQRVFGDSALRRGHVERHIAGRKHQTCDQPRRDQRGGPPRDRRRGSGRAGLVRGVPLEQIGGKCEPRGISERVECVCRQKDKRDGPKERRDRARRPQCRGDRRRDEQRGARGSAPSHCQPDREYRVADRGQTVTPASGNAKFACVHCVVWSR